MLAKRLNPNGNEFCCQVAAAALVCAALAGSPLRPSLGPPPVQEHPFWSCPYLHQARKGTGRNFLCTCIQHAGLSAPGARGRRRRGSALL